MQKPPVPLSMSSEPSVPAMPGAAQRLSSKEQPLTCQDYAPESVALEKVLYPLGSDRSPHAEELRKTDQR